MRLSAIALFAAATAVSFASSAAPQSSNGDVVEVRAAQPKKVYIDPTMYQRMQGAYRLDDGRVLRVTGKSRKLFADVGDGPLEIVHVGSDRFEAVGKDLSVRFEGGPYPHTLYLKDASGRELASTQR